ncbi:Alkali-sensitive linkage protein 1 [Penicillium rolfsii]|nr:Alkali-sensitive linkage protein 1 [Penicillium rolfsii]
MVSFTQLFTTGLLATSALAIPVSMPVTVEVQKRNSTTNTSKRGAAYNDISTVSVLASTGTISWAYNWALAQYGTLPSNIDYVPMLWGAKDFGGWFTAVETALSSGSEYIMGFNEPDMSSQANMSPSEAASYYNTYITPFSGKAKLISPAVSSSTTAGLGLSWFEEFMGDCSSCGITGLAVHWYGNTADEFTSFVEQAISTATSYGLSEVWVTEFALNSDVNGVTDAAATVSFLETVLPWLDAQTSVTRYSYFMCAENYLLVDDALNQAGQTYTS